VGETEAEAIAFVVGQTIGLSTGRASADYIHLYHGNMALLTESLVVIQKTSAVILSALEDLANDAKDLYACTAVSKIRISFTAEAAKRLKCPNAR
jgi:hypothetical protein